MTDTEIRSEPERWTSVQRVAFRFVFTLFTIVIFPWPLTFVPLLNTIANAWTRLVQIVAVAIGGILHLPSIVITQTGSSDTELGFVKLLCEAIFAVIVTVVWSALDRKRDNYVRLHDALRTYVRFYVGTMMLGYGMSKIIQTQFTYPSLERLTQPFGTSSPMGLLWTFMGVSHGYNLFTGLGECAGALVFSRRLTTLGALITIGVMSNVAALNYTYDVPVKILSSTLLVMAVFLAAPDFKRLANVLVFDRVALPSQAQPFFIGRRWTIAARALTTLYVIGTLAGEWFQNHTFQVMYDAAIHSPFYGIYNVERFVRNGRVVEPVLTDSTRWRRVIFGSGMLLTAQMMTDTTQYFNLSVDSVRQTMTLAPQRPRGDSPYRSKEAPPDPNTILTVAYSAPDSAHLELKGAVGRDTVEVLLRRIDLAKYTLLSRGFHWVNEYPFQR